MTRTGPLDRLAGRGITLRVKADGMTLQATGAEGLTPADRDELKTARAEVVYRLLLREWYGRDGYPGKMSGGRLVDLWGAYRDLGGDAAEAVRVEEGR